MGKSTTAALFRDAGCDVWDADAAVHRLYARGGAAVEPIRALCPGAVIDGIVSREILKDWIADSPSNLPQLEAIIHPLVKADRQSFLDETTADITVLDIPLLFETGSEAEVDVTVVVSVDSDIQRTRVLARPGMTDDMLNVILERQMPDATKRGKADYVIETYSISNTQRQVEQLIEDIKIRHA